MAIRPDALTDQAAGDQGAEELRLWADYYEAVTQTLRIVSAGGITAATFDEIVAANARASAALMRIRQLRGPQA